MFNWKCIYRKLLKSAVSASLCFAVQVSPVNAQETTIPNFWDPNERFVKPDLSKLARLRFLTTTDFPPFNFIDRDKNLAGFHIDLARAICDELEILNRCEIQAIPWDDLSKALKSGQGEALIAGLNTTKETRKELDFTRAYLEVPARFVVRKDADVSAPAYDALFKKKTGVIAGSAHAKYFASAFSNRTAEVFQTRAEAFSALQEGNVTAVFSDAVSISFWLSSSASKDCCEYLDGPYLSKEYFGNGLSVAVSKENQELVAGMNYALSQINEKGVFAELYLRYFPIGLF